MKILHEDRAMIKSSYEKIENFIFRVFQNDYDILTIEYVHKYMKNFKYILQKQDIDILIFNCKIKPISEKEWFCMEKTFQEKFELI